MDLFFKVGISWMAMASFVILETPIIMNFKRSFYNSGDPIYNSKTTFITLENPYIIRDLAYKLGRRNSGETGKDPNKENLT